MLECPKGAISPGRLTEDDLTPEGNPLPPSILPKNGCNTLIFDSTVEAFLDSCDKNLNCDAFDFEM